MAAAPRAIKWSVFDSSVNREPPASNPDFFASMAIRGQSVTSAKRRDGVNRRVFQFFPWRNSIDLRSIECNGTGANSAESQDAATFVSAASVEKHDAWQRFSATSAPNVHAMGMAHGLFPDQWPRRKCPGPLAHEIHLPFEARRSVPARGAPSKSLGRRKPGFFSFNSPRPTLSEKRNPPASACSSAARPGRPGHPAGLSGRLRGPVPCRPGWSFRKGRF